MRVAAESAATVCHDPGTVVRIGGEAPPNGVNEQPEREPPRKGKM